MIYLKIWAFGTCAFWLVIPAIGIYINGFSSSFKKLKSINALIAISSVSILWPVAFLATIHAIYDHTLEIVKDLIKEELS